MGDLGGGSLELVALGHGRHRRLEHAAGRAAAPDVVGQERSQAHVVDAIESVRWLREETGKTFYAVGGAWRSFARLHMEQAGYPLHIIHQYEIAADEARAVARLIAVQSAKSLEKMPGVSRRRVDTPAARLPGARPAAGRAQAQDRGVLGLRPARGLLLFAAERGRAGARHPLIAFAEEQGAGWRRFDLSPTEIFDWLTPGLRRRKRGRPRAAHRRLPSQRHFVERPSRLSRRAGLCPRAASAGAGHEPSRARRSGDDAGLSLQERPQVGDARYRAQAFRQQGHGPSRAGSAPASGSPTTCAAARPACCRRSSSRRTERELRLVVPPTPRAAWATSRPADSRAPPRPSTSSR